MKTLFPLIICVLLLQACGDACTEAPDVSDFKQEIKIDRVDKFLRTASLEDVKKKLSDDQEFSKIVAPPQLPREEVAYQLYALGRDTVFNQLYNEVDETYKSIEHLEEDLSSLFANVQYHFNDWQQPEVKTFVSGFGGFDLIQTKGMTMIGLDYFLGPNPKYYDDNFPGYILKYYTKEQLPFKVSMAISNQFNEVDGDDQTVLAHMIFYGKAYYFTKSMFPCTADSVICEYSTQEIALLEQDPKYVWDHFIEKRLFYNTDRAAIQKYIDDRPKVFEIGENCPGRVGRWLGYKIVESYMREHPEVSLPMLMSETDSKKIFNDSHYHPGE